MISQFNTERQAIAEFIESELKGLFSQPSAPQYPFQLASAVARFCDVLEQRLGDPELDAIGQQITQCITNYKSTGEIGNLPDRLEPFLKFIYRLIKGGAANGTLGRDRMFLPDVLLNLGLIGAVKETESDLSAAAGRPRFAWQVIRAVQARNEVHRAPVYTGREKVEIFESVCGVMLFAICEHFNAIDNALLALSQRDLLEQYQEDFDKWRKRVVDLEGIERADIEFEGIDPLAFEVSEDSDEEWVGELDDEAESIEIGERPKARSGLVKTLVQDIPKMILLGDAGAGKSTTLQYLAWQSATTLLRAPGENVRLPIYIQLKLLSAGGPNALEDAINQELKGITFSELRNRRCILLLDGLNEVQAEALPSTKQQIQKILNYNDDIHVVVTCRPSLFQNEFGTPVFELNSLTDDQILKFLRKHLKDIAKAEALARILQSNEKLRDWARNPFMLAMVVRVYARTGELPSNRGHLLKTFIEDIIKRERIQGASQTPVDVKITLLAQLAFSTRRQASLSFSYLDAISILKTRRDEIGSSIDLPAFTDELINNNLLARTKAGLLTFDHELYQEILCALALAELGAAALPLIYELTNEPTWEEPILLYHGLTEEKEPLIRLILEPNVYLAARCLSSDLSLGKAAREAVLARALEVASSTSEPDHLTNGLLSLAELSQREAIVKILITRGGCDATAHRAVKAFVARFRASELITWVEQITKLPERYIVRWSLQAITPEQSESLLRSFAIQLEAVFEEQAQKAWRVDIDAKHLSLLWGKWGAEVGPKIVQKISSRLLSNQTGLEFDSWATLKQLAMMEPAPTFAQTAKGVFLLAIEQGIRTALFVAATIWSFHWARRELTPVVQAMDDTTLKRAIRLLRKQRSLLLYELSMELSQVLRRRGQRKAQEDPSFITSQPARRELLSNLTIGQILIGCEVRHQTQFGLFAQVDPRNDALIHATDFSWDRNTGSGESLQIGDKVDAVVLEIEDWSGHVLLGIKQLQFAKWQIATRTYTVGSIVTGKVVAVENGTVRVAVGGADGVIPKGDYQKRDECIEAVANLKAGEEITAQVTANDAANMRLMLSLSAVTPTCWAGIEKKHMVGDVVDGVVRRIVAFGIFVRLGSGATGLLHRKALGNLGIPCYLQSEFKVGQSLKVRILDVDGANRKMSLALAAPPADPWATAAERYKVGDIIECRVINYVPWGVFVEVERFMLGLIHTTEVRWGKVKRIADYLAVGERVKVKVLEIDPTEKKISLSLKALLPDPWTAFTSQNPVGKSYIGTVVKVAPFGLLVEVQEGVTGMIHISSLPDSPSKSVAETFVSVGDHIHVIVRAVDEDKRYLDLVPEIRTV